MDVKFALLADAVLESREGKLVVAGEFDTLFAQRAPATHPGLALVARFEAHVSEGTQHKVRIGLFDEDGGAVLPLSPDLPMRFVPRGRGRALRAQVILQVGMLTLPRFGDYEFKILVDGHDKATVPLRLAELKNTQHVQG